MIHIDVKKLGRIHAGACKRITAIKRNPRRTHVDAEGVNAIILGHHPPITRVTNFLGSYT